MSKTVIGIFTFFTGTLLAGAASVGLVMYSSQFPTETEVKQQEQIKEMYGKLAELTEELNESQQELASWKERLPELHREIRDTEDQLSRRQRELEKIDDKINEANRTLDNLGKAIGAVKQLRKSEFAMIGGDSILGLSVKQNKFQVVGEVEDELARIARQAVVRWRMPLYTGDADLSRKLSSAYDPGEPLFDSDQRLLNEIYRTHRFVDPPPEGSARMVHLRDSSANITRVGFYRNHDEDSVELNTIDNSQEVVRRTAVAPGTAVMGNADAIVEGAQHLQFLDLCCLEIARRMGTPTGKRSIPPRVAILVDCVVPGRSRLGLSGTPLSDGAEDSSTSMQLPNTASVLQGKLDRTTWSRQLEDELHEKLIKLNVPVLERKYLKALDAERLLASERNQAYPESLRMVATHLFVCRIDLSALNGSSRLAVRLLDISSDEALWAGNFTPTKALEQHTRYHVASGQLFVINPGGMSAKTSVPIVRKKLNPKDPSTLSNRLVVFEKGVASNDKVALRDIFSSEVTILDKKLIKKAKHIQTGEDVPRDLLPKYMTYSIYSRVMPQAGMIVEDENNFMHARMRNADKIMSIGASLTAFQHISDGSHYQPPSRFPNHLAVNNVSADGIRLADGLGRVKLIWSENEAIAPGDIVVPPGQQAATVIFDDLQFEAPPEEVWKKIRGGTNKREKFHRLSMELGDRLTRGLAKASAFVGINVVNNTNNNRYRTVSRYSRGHGSNASNVNYTVRGTVSPLGQSTFKVDLFVLDRENNPIQTEQFAVLAKQVEKWNPTR